MRHSVRQYFLGITITLLFVFNSELYAQWKTSSGNDPFDGSYKAAWVIGNGTDWPYTSPRLTFNLFDGGEDFDKENLVSNFYLSSIGYTGCENYILKFKFDNKDPIFYTRELSTNSEKDAIFFKSLRTQNNSQSDYYSEWDVLDLFKKHNYVHVRYENSCGEINLKFNLSGSSRALDYVFNNSEYESMRLKYLFNVRVQEFEREQEEREREKMIAEWEQKNKEIEEEIKRKELEKEREKEIKLARKEKLDSELKRLRKANDLKKEDLSKLSLNLEECLHVYDAIRETDFSIVPIKYCIYEGLFYVDENGNQKAIGRKYDFAEEVLHYETNSNFSTNTIGELRALELEIEKKVTRLRSHNYIKINNELIKYFRQYKPTYKKGVLQNGKNLLFTHTLDKTKEVKLYLKPNSEKPLRIMKILPGSPIEVLNHHQNFRQLVRIDNQEYYLDKFDLYSYSKEERDVFKTISDSWLGLKK